MAVPGAVADPSGLLTEDVTYLSDGAAIRAYLALPRGEGPHPGVIVTHAAFGPVEHIRDLARRFANAGFIALAPHLYTRVGDPHPNDMSSVMPKMLGLEDAQIVRDLEAAADFICEQPA